MKAPWQERRERISELLREKLAPHFGITSIDPFLTLRFYDEKKRLTSVTLVISETNVVIPEPPDGGKEAEARRQKVRQARVKDRWASPSGPLGWLCPESPSGYCWYDDEVDPRQDHCLGCGHPEERK